MRMSSWYHLVWNRKCLTSLKWCSYASVSGEDSFISALCMLYFLICKEKETYLSMTRFLPFENKSQNHVFQTRASSRAAAAASAFPTPLGSPAQSRLQFTLDGSKQSSKWLVSRVAVRKALSAPVLHSEEISISPACRIKYGEEKSLFIHVLSSHEL